MANPSALCSYKGKGVEIGYWALDKLKINPTKGLKEYITESQNHRMLGVGRPLWGSPSPTPLLKQSPRAGCTGPCPARSWISPEKENPQPLWATCSSAPSPSEWRSSSSYLLQAISQGSPLPLCPPVNLDRHCVGESTSMLWQLFLCCPVFATRTDPGKTFCSCFCTAHPAPAEFIYREEKGTWRAHWSLQPGTTIKPYFYYFRAALF